jgi:eukaryotic-like serine/threonine-protein kinase
MAVESFHSLAQGNLGENDQSPNGSATSGWLKPSALPEVSDHELVSPIGKGAYGEVWLSRNVFGSLRAVKLVFRRNFTEAFPFEREFKGIQKFEPVSRTHEGLISILQVGRSERDAYFYYVMELADDAGANGDTQEESTGLSGLLLKTSSGSSKPYLPRTLRHEVRRLGRLPSKDCLEIGLRLTAALHHLHEAGLVHRDVKPSNIIFVRGAPSITMLSNNHVDIIKLSAAAITKAD